LISGFGESDIASEPFGQHPAGYDGPSRAEHATR
jgi:hypothetical protein